MARLPPGLVDAWDRASPRERALVRWGTIVVALAVLYAVAWQPLVRDIARTGDAVAHDRAALAVVRAYADAPTPNAAANTGALVEPRVAVTRALEARGLRAAASSIEAREGRVAVVIGAVTFDALVLLLDDMARTDGVRALEARLTARVEPGTVRAELTLGR